MFKTPRRVSNSLLWARCIKLSLWKFYANDNCNLMKCRKVWSNKAYFEYERNWEKLTWNIKQSYSGLFPIWIGLHRHSWIPQCTWAGGYSQYFAPTLISFSLFLPIAMTRLRFEICSATKFLFLKTMIFSQTMIITRSGSSLIGCLAEIRPGSRGQDENEHNFWDFQTFNNLKCWGWRYVKF